MNSMGAANKEIVEHDNSCKKWSVQTRLRLADSLFTSVSEGVCITDNEQRILEINQTLCNITGFSSSEILGRTPKIFASEIHSKLFFDTMWLAICKQGQWQGEVWNRNGSGGLYAIRLNISAVYDSNQKITHYVGIMGDVTQQKLDLAAITKSANIDSLTGLPNRLLFTDRLLQAISQADRNKAQIAVCFLDMDHFKNINDIHGHQSGDIVLKEIARRLTLTIRAGDTAARLGGDEFVLLLWGVEKKFDCNMLLERVRHLICQPIILPDTTIFPATSMGVAIYPSDAVLPDVLVALADAAMYRAKTSGGNRTIYHHKGAD
ncbi:sensor domain-containing diguanylate cyclase [Paludibacterium purpuratum]|uniref:PAS domain S-box-containing protein/diguanylate cyclase (GGDEF)-like protein n=1 Tax=Paludibacterium purpuratum TaxID=1144873 RepID=A0A4R7BGE8_9NEIS|nr:sensor domain-containing diguanylate cyclase [Paludibacterium purpuratum]TDR82796.1 PAS domain S-box-containing protein/diguanylate cyclase (GGDEF)-like protein [Paludibacterium purpuratum]